MKFLRLPYSIYAVLIIFILFIPALPVYILIKLFVSYENQQFWVHKTNRTLFLIWSALTGWTYKIRGVEHINPAQNYIAICNHTNLADFMASAYGIQVPGKPLVKKEILKIPIFGQLFAMASIPLDRKNEKSRRESMETMLRELSINTSLIIFPEGTRNRTPQPLKEFHNGAFALSMKSGVPILPVMFTHVRELSTAESMLIRPWRLNIEHLEPVFPKDFESVQDLKDFIYKKMWNYLIDNESYYSNYKKL